MFPTTVEAEVKEEDEEMVELLELGKPMRLLDNANTVTKRTLKVFVIVNPKRLLSIANIVTNRTFNVFVLSAPSKF